jgi:hypothetical protein
MKKVRRCQYWHRLMSRQQNHPSTSVQPTPFHATTRLHNTPLHAITMHITPRIHDTSNRSWVRAFRRNRLTPVEATFPTFDTRTGGAGSLSHPAHL